MKKTYTYKIFKLFSNFNISIYKLLLISFFLNLTASAQNTQIAWYSFSTGYGETSLASTSLRSLIGDPIVGTSSSEGSNISGGFFSNPVFIILTAVNEKANSDIPSTFQLNQNYPNPFNPVTNIKFSLPKQSSVKIIIYDLLGRRVKTLLDENHSAGYFTVRWSGDNDFNIKVSSGIYFLSFSAIAEDNNKYTSIKKMILLK
jgi:hypothetical protein